MNRVHEANKNFILSDRYSLERYHAYGKGEKAISDMTSSVQGYAHDCLAGDDVARAHVILMGVAADRWGECLDYWVQGHPPDAGVGADWRDARPPLIWRTPSDSGAPKSPPSREGMMGWGSCGGKRKREGEMRPTILVGRWRWRAIFNPFGRETEDAVRCRRWMQADFFLCMYVFYSRVVES